MPEPKEEDTGDLMSMVKTKSKLTKEIREAGISSKDQEFMSSFTDMMTSDNNVPSLDSIAASGDKNDKVANYVPDEKELQNTLNKAKEMNKSIMKEVHPEEFKKQEELKKQKAE